jgi:hypothetical protein
VLPHLPNLTSEPSAADLEAIEQEWPLIAAEIDLLDAQIVVMVGPSTPTDLDRQRVRRAQRRVLREARTPLAARTAAVELASKATRKTPTKRIPRVDAVPAAADLAVIEAEWPSIAAELDARPAGRKTAA